ncbi:MAG: hypothetical protein E7355_05460 [Clostridiales bacterium]|nr:hypothetical protein [Clostridiales bacterium]
MKDKYNDNKLAEEFDLIVLTDDTLANNGLPRGSLGTLTYSYTGGDTPLYGEFAFADGSTKETPLSLSCFRVLDARTKNDLSIITRFLQKTLRKKA